MTLQIIIDFNQLLKVNKESLLGFEMLISERHCLSASKQFL